MLQQYVTVSPQWWVGVFVADVSDLELNTERRAEKRAEYEAMKHEHEQEMLMMKKAQEKMREQEEQKEYERQRAAAVHKAKPIQKFKKITVKPSDRPLTQPVTPRFSNRVRAKMDQWTNNLE